MLSLTHLWHDADTMVKNRKFSGTKQKPFHCVRLPIFNNGVADARVWVVIWSRLAGLHKQLCVGDGSGRLDLHEDHLFEVHLHWVSAAFNLFSEPLALEEFKLEGESPEALLCEDVRVLVLESQC